MTLRNTLWSTVLTTALLSAPITLQAAPENGVVKVRSAYSLAETIARIKQDVEAKKIKFFSEIDQAKLAADAGIKRAPSTLLTFGNPALGSQFMTSIRMPALIGQ